MCYECHPWQLDPGSPCRDDGSTICVNINLSCNKILFLIMFLGVFTVIKILINTKSYKRLKTIKPSSRQGLPGSSCHGWHS